MSPSPAPIAAWRTVAGHRYLCPRIHGERLSIPLPAANDAEAEARAARIVPQVRALAELVPLSTARAFGERLARAETEAERLAVENQIAIRLAEASGKGGGPNVRTFAEDWLTGRLAARFPGYVRPIDQADNWARFERWIWPVVGHVSIARLTLEDGQRVMARVPATLSDSARRQIAGCLVRLARLAVFPAKLLAVSPFPPLFLPKVRKAKAAPFLYPEEDARLLGCRAIPLARRFVYGVLAREGLRAGELVGRPGKRGAPPRPPMRWAAIDLAHGHLQLDQNKTDEPRGWKLGDDVRRALERWRVLHPEDLDVVGWIPSLAAHLRADLRVASVTRPELFEESERRVHVKVHHLRATFVTLSLAIGKTEAWVTDRTGHTTSAMIYRYKRAARTAAELDLGWLGPMDDLIPEFRETKPGLHKTRGKR